MRLYKDQYSGAVVEDDGIYRAAGASSWDALLSQDGLHDFLKAVVRTAPVVEQPRHLMPPVESQEVWAAGVTYYRSRSARMDESKAVGGGDFYDRIYHAERPELFLKATPRRVAGADENLKIREDSARSVPEPELTLVISPRGKIIGYTIGNDMTACAIEGENPLYLPQAKVYDGSCALGPGIWVSNEALPSTTVIRMEILRGGDSAFSGSTTLAEMKREPEALVAYLFRHNTFPSGCFLMTGTGIVPPDSFRLEHGDEIRITIEPIGTLVNHVE